MEAPKTMAIKIKKRTIDICIAVDPSFIGQNEPSALFGKYFVINIPWMVNSKHYQGVGFRNALVTPETFAEKYRFVGQNDGGSKIFEPVRRVYPNPDASNTNRRYPTYPYIRYNN